MSYDNNMRGVLFKNDDKTDEKQPDYRGTIVFNNTEMYLAAWINVSKKGTKYMALKVSPKNSDSAQPKKSRADEFDDALPF